MADIALTDAVVAAQYLQTGIEHFRANRFVDAIHAFDAVLRINPEDPYARWNRCTALLSTGDYTRGFQQHDWAWRLFRWTGFHTIGDATALNPLPLWRGQRGVRLLVYHELGYGDAIMAMRYLPVLKRRTKVTLVVDRPLARLAQSFGVEVLTELPRDINRFDARMPLFGAMTALDQTEKTIPGAPYIAANWRRDAGRIGIAWAGRTQTTFALETFVSLLAHDGYALYALRPGPVIAGVEQLDPDADFADVAKLIEQMEHIVSVDTAAVHLAGAMGHPSTHLLLPFLMDWRWWHAELWYPQLKTYRQKTPDQNWSVPFANVNMALRKASMPAQ